MHDQSDNRCRARSILLLARSPSSPLAPGRSTANAGVAGTAARPDSEARPNRARPGCRENGSRAGALAGERLSCATARRPRENPVRNPNASLLVFSNAVLAAISHRFPVADANVLALAGCTPSSRFDVVSATCVAAQSLLRSKARPSASLGSCDPPPRQLGALAMKIGAILPLVLIVALSTGGCVRQLAVEDEYFAAASGSSTRSRVATQHLLSHYRAWQAAQRWCSDVPNQAAPPSEDARLRSGPGLGAASAHEALHGLCAAIPPPRPVAAHGAAANAHRRWVEDDVRELPEAAQTAASAAGGS